MEQAEPECKFALREGCAEEAEPLCSDAQLDSTRCRTDQAEHVLSQGEQIMGLENGPGKTKKASTMNKLAVRERNVAKLTVRERSEQVCNSDIYNKRGQAEHQREPKNILGMCKWL